VKNEDEQGGSKKSIVKSTNFDQQLKKHEY